MTDEKVPLKSYKPREVAERLGCSLDHVYLMIKHGNLEAFTVGGKRNIRVTDIALQDFIERMKVRNHELKHG